MELITQEELNASSEVQNKKISELEKRIIELEKLIGKPTPAKVVKKPAAKKAK